ncbi:hypothetical protein [Streptomyces sp. NPDC048590]|uniref:hypothetical protein n=1 Tax=Streptomyces sp. NPDC048590 TaxID=3365574 RepID=UPI0037106C80
MPHRLSVVLALTACAVLAGATSLQVDRRCPCTCAGTGRRPSRPACARAVPARRDHGPPTAGPHRRRHRGRPPAPRS